eukprot:246575-Prymnesium_polylepis.1
MRRGEGEAEGGVRAVEEVNAGVEVEEATAGSGAEEEAAGAGRTGKSRALRTFRSTRRASR